MPLQRAYALHGVGVDATSSARVAAVLARTPRFADRVFTTAEQRDCRGRPERWASRWAAKEAVRKLAGGRGAAGMPAFIDIEVRLLDNGAPEVSIAGGMHAPIALSLTHEGDLAIAVALVAGAGGGGGAVDRPPYSPVPAGVQLPDRPTGAHKGTFGTVVVVAGSHGFGGAAFLSAMGAARGGAGLVRLCVPRELLPIVGPGCVEVMAHALPDGSSGVLTSEAIGVLRRDHLPHASALVIGPGLGRDPLTGTALRELFGAGLPCPVVVDADALNLAASAGQRWPALDAPTVLTPHPAEMARLLGTSVAEVQRDRAAVAFSYAREHSVVVVLKGRHTVVAGPGGRLHEDRHSLVALATGGTGDVLAGLAGAMLGCGLPPFQAAVAAVTVHAEAGAAVQARRGRAGALAGDLLEELPAAQERVRRVVEDR